jgi:hypothetical protein
MAPKRRRKRVRSQSEKYSGDGDDDDVDDDQSLQQLALRPAGAERKSAGISVEALQNGKATCIRTKIASLHSYVASRKALLAMQDQRNSTTTPQVRDLV